MSLKGYRVACTTCQTHRDSQEPRCPCCGGEFVKTVTATTGDLRAAEQDVIVAAEAIDQALTNGVVLHRSSTHARALGAACRVLSLTRSGVCCR